MAKTTRAKTEPRKRVRQMNGLYLRFECEFMLDDIRMVRLSGEAFRFYVLLSAQALRLRREILPQEYDVQELAYRFRRTTEEIEGWLDELAAGAEGRDPLVYRLPDGRIRVLGIQKKHGEQIKWKDDPHLIAMQPDDNWPTSGSQSPYIRQPVDGQLTTYEDSDTHPPQSPPAMRTASDGQPPNDRQQEAEPNATPVDSNNGSQRPSESESVPISLVGAAERQAFDSLTESWNGDVNEARSEDLRRLIDAHLKAEPFIVLGHVLDIAKDKSVRSGYAVLGKRLRKGVAPPDTLVDRAKLEVRAYQDGGSRHRTTSLASTAYT